GDRAEPRPDDRRARLGVQHPDRRRRRLLQAREDLVRGRAVLPHGPGAQQRVAAPPGRNPARAAAVAAVPAPEGIVTDEPRRNASPSLRAEVKTQDELEIATLRGKVAFFEEENS